MRNFLLLFFLCFAIGQASSQGLFEKKYQLLQKVDTLPTTMMTGKTAVLLTMAGDNEKEWNRVKQSFHEQVRKTGIDAVVYYSFELPFSGQDVINKFIEDFERREINNLVLLHYRGEDSKLAVMSLNKSFLRNSEPYVAWKLEGPFKDISKQLYIQTANSGYERTNFLINDVAENGFMKDPIDGERNEFFSLKLKRQKLAVPYIGSSLMDTILVQTLKESYPYEFEMVDSKLSEKELEAQGYNFLLRSITSEVAELRRMLGYEIQDNVNAYVSTMAFEGEEKLVKIRAVEEATKFYIKDIDKNEVYLGTQWDADRSWIQALLNHLFIMENQIGS